MVLHGIAWYCMVLHGLNIAVVAQKVKVVNEDQCDLKKWGAGPVVGQDGY